MQIQDLFWIFSKFAVYTFAYFMGRFNYGITSLIPILFTAFHDFNTRKRDHQRIKTHCALQMTDRQAVLGRLDEVPAWVLFPDYERMEWFNEIVRRVWPVFNEILEEHVRKFEEKLRDSSGLSTFKFTTINLGKSTPRITGIKVYNKNLYDDSLIIDLNFCYFGDCEFSFSLKKIEGGIKNLEAEGALRIIFKPQVPFVSLIQIYFLRHPMVDFELTSALASLDMFQTGDLIRSVLKEQISKNLVFPNKIDIKIKKEAENPIFKMPNIEGVIQIFVIDLEDFESELEVNVKLSLGSQFEETKFVKISEGVGKVNQFIEMISYEKGDDELNLAVSNQDFSVIASKSFKIDDIKFNKFIWQIFPLTPSGRISLKLSWLSPSNVQTDDPSLLQIFIDSVRGINSKYRPYIQVSVNDHVQQTPSTLINKEVGKYQKYFNFFIQNVKFDALELRVIDDLSTNTLGEYTYDISELLIRRNYEHNLQAFPLSSSIDFEIVLALKLNLLKIPKEI